MPIKSVAEAILEAQTQLLKESPDYYIIGEGLGDRKRAFGTVPDRETFPGRIWDMPVSENGMTGVCIGSAIAGMRPIMVHMRADFLLYAADQIINNAAKWYAMFGGQRSVPMVIRAVIGRGFGQGLQHSQHLEKIFSQIPGLKVMCPSNAFDAKGMLIAAARDPNPVLFFEHRWLHGLRCEVPDEMYEVQAVPNRIRGGIASLAAWGYMVHECLKASEIVKSQLGIPVAVTDLRKPTGESIVDIVIEEGSCCPPAFALSREFYPTASSIATMVAARFNKTVSVDATEFHDVPNLDFTGPF